MLITQTNPNILGKIGTLVVKIAETPEEIRAAQELRHSVFFKEQGRRNDAVTSQHDEDQFDLYCDHLIVVDSALAGKAVDAKNNNVVATYRLLGQEKIQHSNGFYSSKEFDIDPLLARQSHLKFLEFGRSCVLPQYRTKRTVELLWHGSWAYVKQRGYDVMFGCASFEGVLPDPHLPALEFLAANAKSEDGWQVKALGEKISLGSSNIGQGELKHALRAMPPLIKGYLRLGAMFASEAVIDRAFNTIDVLVLLPIQRLNPRYVSYYGENADKHSLS